MMKNMNIFDIFKYIVVVNIQYNDELVFIMC